MRMMRTLAHPARPGARASVLTVLLPGAYGKPEDFQREGFISAVRERGLPADVVIADMNLEYITGGNALTLLRDTVIAPARSAGYRHIRLAGISIGGLMAMAYADHYPGEVDGLCLIAPYPGSRTVAAEIDAAGGVRAWSPGDIARDDFERRVWRWLKNHAAGPATVYLGYGAEDRFAAAYATMAAVLPADRICVVPGRHDWDAWRKIWERFLDRGAAAPPPDAAAR